MSELKLVPTMNAGVVCPDADEVECIARQLESNGFRIFASEVRRLWREVETLKRDRDSAEKSLVFMAREHAKAYASFRCPICGSFDCKNPNCGSRY